MSDIIVHLLALIYQQPKKQMKTKIQFKIFSALVLAVTMRAFHIQAQTQLSGGAAASNTCSADNGGYNNTSVGCNSGRAAMTGSNNTSIGDAAGAAFTTGYNNTLVGGRAGTRLTTGYYNVFNGYNAGALCSESFSNNAFGFEALSSNTKTSDNVAVGRAALFTQDWTAAFASFNVAIGNYALYYNKSTSTTNGLYNTAVGDHALYNNSTGKSNTVLGFEAGKANTSASDNTFLGKSSGWGNTTGTQNVFAGVAAGYTNSTANYSTITGYYAGFSSNANYCSFYGIYSGYTNTSGAENVLLGTRTGYLNSTGDYNTFAGDGAGYYNTVSNNTGFGFYAGHDNTTGTENTCLGYHAGYNNTTTTGGQNTFLGSFTGVNHTTGDHNTYVGYNADANAGTYTNATAIGNGAVAPGSNKVQIGNGSVTNVYSAPNAWGSDGRFKFNIKEEVKGLEFIKKLRPITYQMDTKKWDDFIIKNMPDSIKIRHQNGINFAPSTSITHSGFIAQEVEKAASDCGFFCSIAVQPSDTSSGYYALSYAEFVVPLVKAVQELSHTVDSLLALTNIGQRMMQNNGNQQPNIDTVHIRLALLDGATLGEPQPNPNTGNTQIPYYLPQNTIGAKIIFTDMLGKVMYEKVLQCGYGLMNVDTQDLPAGIYSYSLIVEGKVMDTKKMIRNK